MNLPNKLTVTRLVLAPFFFLAYFLIDLIPSMNAVLYAVILAVFYAVMELSDLLDGKIARARNLVTDLGKVLDTFFTCLLASGIMPVWAYIFILWREFSQSFTRMLMMGKGKAMAANIFGKAKTCLYALTCICGFAFRILLVLSADQSFMRVYSIVLTVLFALAAFSSVMSYLIYVRAIIQSKALSGMTR